MKDNGKMIYKMDMELKPGQMAQDTKVTTKQLKSMVKEHILGMMAQNMLEIG